MRRALLAFLLLAGRAMACPTCKDALAEDPAGRGFSVGIGITVVGMLAVIFTLAGLIVVKIVRDDRRAASQGSGQGPA